VSEGASSDGSDEVCFGKRRGKWKGHVASSSHRRLKWFGVITPLAACRFINPRISRLSNQVDGMVSQPHPDLGEEGALNMENCAARRSIPVAV